MRPGKATVEENVYIWLKEVTGGWSVTPDIPTKRPNSFVTFDRTGGGYGDLVLDRAEILVEVYDKNSRTLAMQETQKIARTVNKLLEFENVTRAEINSIIHLDDVISGYHRYQIYLDVYQRITIVD